MSPNEYAQLMQRMGDVAISVEEVKGDVKEIRNEVKNRPCDRHEREINELATKVEDLEKEQIRSFGARAFFTRLLAVAIPMIPIGIALWKLFHKVGSSAAAGS